MRSLLLVPFLLCGCHNDLRDGPGAVGSAKSGTGAQIAAIECFGHAKSLSELNVDGRIALCSGAAEARAPVECYEKARATYSELNANGAVALCSTALDLLAIQGAQENMDGQKRLELKLNGISAQLTTIANR